jgi:hypothetical protein
MNLFPFHEIAELMQRALLNEKRNFLPHGGLDSKERTLQGLTYFSNSETILRKRRNNAALLVAP